MNIQDTVLKLIRLSKNNSSAQEAATAFAQAQRLIIKHNLDEALLNEDKSLEADFHQRTLFQGKRKPVWKTRLAQVITEVNNCYIWQVRTPAGDFALMVAGTQNELDLVEYMFNHMCSQIDICTKNYMQSQNMGRQGAKTISNSFRMGMVTTLKNKLQETVEEIIKEYEGTQAMVVVSSRGDLVKDWVHSQFDLVSKKTFTSKIENIAYSQGIEAGRNVEIRRALK